MPTNLSNGYQNPSDTDNQQTWTEVIENNFSRLATHDHDGSDSTALAVTSITPTTQTIAASGWSSQGNGLYRQQVTLPGTIQFDNINPLFKIDDDIIYPTVEKTGTQTYYIYINDSSKDVVAVYR